MGRKIEINVATWRTAEDGGGEVNGTYRKIIDSDDIKDLSEVHYDDKPALKARVLMKNGKKYMVTDGYEELREKFLGDDAGNARW